MQGFTGLRQPVEKPGALQLAIREWQRQLIKMAEAATHQAAAAAPTAGDYWCPDDDLFDDA
jgi:hypothetical protein